MNAVSKNEPRPQAEEPSKRDLPSGDATARPTDSQGGTLAAKRKRRSRVAPRQAAQGKSGQPSRHPDYTTRSIRIKRADHRTVGEVGPDGVFRKRLKFSIHIYRNHNSICFDICTLEQARNAGATWVEVLDMETGRVYHASIATVLADSRPVPNVPDQIGLTLSKWTKGPVKPAGFEQLPLPEVA
jgi:hypothetical protein